MKRDKAPEQVRQSEQTPSGKKPGRKPYVKPALTAHGDVRTVTLAPSPGTFESGYGSGHRDPNGPQKGRSGDERDTRPGN